MIIFAFMDFKITLMKNNNQRCFLNNINVISISELVECSVNSIKIQKLSKKQPKKHKKWQKRRSFTEKLDFMIMKEQLYVDKNTQINTVV